MTFPDYNLYLNCSMNTSIVSNNRQRGVYSEIINPENSLAIGVPNRSTLEYGTGWSGLFITHHHTAASERAESCWLEDAQSTGNNPLAQDQQAERRANYEGHE
jgi:hypothetical protein